MDMVAGQRLRILDAGCDFGKHTTHLARGGHSVVGVDTNESSLREASRAAQERSVSEKCHFIQADVRAFPFTSEVFDAAVCTEMLHLMRKPESRLVIESLEEIVRPGGLNIISGYLVEPGSANPTNNARCFHPGELHGAYESASWKILSYSETMRPIQRMQIGESDREHIFSKAAIIAQKV